jgi:hypothetical protein
VATKKSVILNITTNTPDWVKDHVETRRNLRRSKRSRKTPYRACRENRSTLRQDRVPPSTKARWQAKLRIIKFLLKVIPITIINVEDIKAISKKGKKKWNVSFSPLEVGKKWFYKEIENLSMRLIKTEGYHTFQHRDQKGYKKSKKKLDYTWEAHNVDSHSLCEMSFGINIQPYYGIWQLNFLQFHRRQLHVQNYANKHIRKPYGTTISLGMSRGSVIKYQGKLYYLGGSSQGKIAIHSIITGKRIKQHIKKDNIKMLYTSTWRAQFLPQLKQWVSLRNLG